MPARPKGATARAALRIRSGRASTSRSGGRTVGASFAHVVRVDKDDNVWVVDEGSNMVIKFNPQGLVTLVLGRKDEAIDYLEATFAPGKPRRSGRAELRWRSGGGRGAGRGWCGGNFGRPTDVDLGHAGQHLRRRRLHQLARGEVRQGRRLREVASARARQRSPRPVQHAAHDRRPTRRATSTSATAATQRIQVFDPDLNLVRHHQQRARAVGHVHHAAQRAAGSSSSISAGCRRQDLTRTTLEGKPARLVRLERQESRPVLLGALRCTALARTSSTPARRRTGACSGSR